MKNIEQIQKEFPIFTKSDQGTRLVFLDSAASAQKPKIVLDRMNEFTQTSYANVHRGLYHLSQKATSAFEEAREKVAKFIHASPDEIVFTRSLTEGINLLAQSFVKPQLSSGDEVIVSAMEHHSNLVSWQMICEETGAKLKILPIHQNGELDLEALPSLLNSKTRVIAIAHVSNVLGTINPIEKITKLAHQKNIPVIVDGAQGVPHLPVDVQKLDCDFYLFTGHKLYGPTGTGAIFGKANLWKNMKPYHGGGEMVDEVGYEKSTYKDPPARFEAGTPNIIGAVGLGYAIDFVQSVGFEQIQSHEKDLFEYAMEKMKKIPGIRFLGEAKEKIGLISFVLEGVHPHDVAAILDQEAVAVRVGHHCAQPLHNFFGVTGSIRVSFGMYNTRQDIDRLIQALEKARKMLS